MVVGGTPLRTGFAITAVIGAALAGGCGASQDAGNGGGLPVVVTSTQVADFTREIGGDNVTVTQIIKPNVDPHDYEPSPADIVAIGKAKIVVKNGVGLEPWLGQTITAAGFTGTLVDSSQNVRIHEGSGDEHGNRDPHIWHDPRNAKIMVQNIERALADADPGNATAYQHNLDSYLAELDKLDAENEAKIRSIPAARRKLVTNHDALGYYVRRYGFEFIGSIIPSFDTSAEPSGRQIQDLIAKIKASGVPAVFSESSLPPKTAEVVRQAGVRVVAGADSLYVDSLGPPGTAGATYLDAETHNTDVIVQALRN